MSDTISSRDWFTKKTVVEDLYGVMQSDGYSFCGDVVSDIFNETSRDEDNI